MGGLCLLLDFGFAGVICVLNWLLGLRISGLLGLRWLLVISVVLAVFWVFPGFRVWWVQHRLAALVVVLEVCV